MAVVELNRVDAEDTLARIGAFVDFVASLDTSAYSGGAAMTVTVQLARAEKACVAAGARFAAHADKTAAPRASGASDTADWLGRTRGQPAGQARAALDLVDELDELPATKQAVDSGAISIEQAKEIVRTESAAPGSEAEMLALTATQDLRGLKEQGLKRRQAQIDPDELRARQLKAETASHGTEPELGMVELRARLAPEHGVPFVSRLDAETTRLHKAAKAAGNTDTTWDQHRAQALLNMVNGEDSGKGRTDLVVVADLNALRRGEARDGEPVHIVGGGPVPVSFVHEILDADPFLKLVLHDGVQVQAVKHQGRKKLSAEVLTALQIGFPPLFDGPCCSIPGCTRRAHLEKDHIEAVTNGGVTSLANSQWLCWYHHIQKTERDLGRAPP